MGGVCWVVVFLGSRNFHENAIRAVFPVLCGTCFGDVISNISVKISESVVNLCISNLDHLL